MSRVRANKLTNRAGSGAPELTYGAEVPVGYGITGAGGINVSGMITATAGFAGDATGLTGTPDINVRNIVAVGATFSGVLNYEDVTNIDSVGIVTARTGIRVLAGGANIVGVTTAASGLNVTAGGVNVVGGGITATGIGTFYSGLNTEDILAEEVNVVANKLSAVPNISVEDGMVHLFTTAESTTSTPNIRYNGSTALNARMSIGQSVVVTLITTANASGYSAQMTIDGAAQTERWIGGSAPSSGGSAGVDIHSFTIIKTADATFTVIGNHSKTS